jgi:Flp pilus assembly pilin Flp
MKNLIARFVREDAGQDLIEYAVLVGIITVGTIAIVGTVAGQVTGIFTKLSTALNPLD